MIRNLSIGSQIFVVTLLALLSVTLGKVSPTVSKVNISETDAFHYQVQAVNLVKFHSYPDLTLHAPPEVYFIDTLQHMGLSSLLTLKLLTQHPPVNDFTKPPFYPLIISAIYALFGINPQYVVNFHAWVIIFTAIAQVFIAIRLLSFWGLPIGVLSGLIYYNVTIPDVANFYPHFLVQFFILIIFWIRIDRKKLFSRNYAAAVGLLLGLMVLTNGNTVFIPLLILAYQFVRCFKQGRYKSLLFMFLAFLFTLSPWILFANIRLAATKAERAEWVASVGDGVVVKKQAKAVFHNHTQLTATDSMVMKLCILNMYSKFCTDGYVIISKQPFGDEILGAHNEFSYDGNFHPEWRFLSNSYYNTYPSSSPPLLRIIGFYYSNPQSLVRNVVGKLNGTFYVLSPLYFLAWLLIICIGIWQVLNLRLRLIIPVVCITVYYGLPFVATVAMVCAGSVFILFATLFSTRLWVVPHVFTFTIINTVIIVLLFVGVPRYVQIIDPILLMAVSVSVFSFFLKPAKQAVFFLVNALVTQFKRLRLAEVLLMSGYFWVAALTATSYMPELTTHVAILGISIICYIASVYCLNSYTDYESDKDNPRLVYLSQVPRHYYLYWLLFFVGIFVCLSAAVNLHILYLQIASFLLWVLYYQKPFQLKGRFPGGTIIHFAAGILHFHMGYEIVWGSGFISLMISLFFASMLSLGHLNHERIDAEADKLQGVGTGSARFGNKIILPLFYTGFILSQAYWCLLLKWKLIPPELWASFFQFPFIVLIALTPYRNNLVSPYGVQTIFRALMLVGFVAFFTAKLIA